MFRLWLELFSRDDFHFPRIPMLKFTLLNGPHFCVQAMITLHYFIDDYDRVLT